MALAAHSKQDVSQYARFWTTELNQHLLFTIKCYTEVEYLIYHIPTKTVVILPSTRAEREVIARMLERGVRVVDDHLLTEH